MRAFRLALISLGLILCVTHSVEAQEWARKMFNKLDHNFETVARGSDTLYKFELKNIYKETIHISSVRSSCGCTSPTIENNTIKTYEKGFILAKFNTRTFKGPHSATLTVTIDRPFYAEVQLRVHGNIRGDIVFQPGAVQFHSYDQGEDREQTVEVSYAGRSGWEIKDVRSLSKHIEVEMNEKYRNGGIVKYDLLVRAKASCPAGFLKEQLILVTNDLNNPRIPLDIEAKIVPELSVSPAKIVLGEITAGQSIKKKLIVRGKRPFVVASVECEDGCFEFHPLKTKPSKIHVVEVVFKAREKAGKIKVPITVRTNLGESFVTKCIAYAEVKPAVKAESLAPESNISENKQPSSDSSSTARTESKKNPK